MKGSEGSDIVGSRIIRVWRAAGGDVGRGQSKGLDRKMGMHSEIKEREEKATKIPNTS